MRTATLFGFPVMVNPAWLLVFALLIVSLVTSVAGTGPAMLPGEAALGVSAVVVVLFVASVVAHELTHALVARRRGLPIRPIQLLTLGQPVETEPEPTSPLTEVLVAASGPLVSAVIGGGLLLVALAFPADTAQPLSLVYWTVYWLALAYLVLAVFHLVPVLPLDGGRLVRAVAWRIGGDLDRGTRGASVVGRPFGYAVVGSGLFVALFVELFLGIWLVLLGWFSGRLSRTAVDRRRMERLTAGLTVEDATDTSPAVVPPSLTVVTLMEQDEQNGGPGIYPVFEGERLLGVIFLSRLRRSFRRDWAERRTADVLIPIERAPSLRPGEPLMHAVERLEATRADGLPVLEASDPPRLVGVITRQNVMARLRARQTISDERARSAADRARG